MKEKIILLLFIFYVLFFIPNKFIASGSVLGEKVNVGNLETKKEKTYFLSEREEKDLLKKLKSKDEKENFTAINEIYKKILQASDEKEQKGELIIKTEILDEIKKFAWSSNSEVKKNVFKILSKKGRKQLKEVIDAYLDGEDDLYKGYAIQKITNEKNPKYKEKFINMLFKEKNEYIKTCLIYALNNYNDPTIIDRIKSVFEDLTEPVKALNEAFRNDDINKLKSLMNEKAGFLLRIIAPGNAYIPNKVISVKEAIEFFEKSEYYNLKNIEGIEFGCQDELSPYVKQDKNGRIYVYVTENDYFGFFEKEGIHILSKAPFVLIGVKCLVGKIDTTNRTDNFRVYFSKIANKWYFVGLEEWQCQK